MSEVGALVIRLQAETAQFRSDMGKVKADLNDLKGGTTVASEGMSTFGGAAGGVRTQLGLVDNVIRGRLPMAFADLIRGFSQSEIVMKALPIAATVAGIGVVALVAYKAGEAWKEFQDKLSKAQSAIADTASSSRDLAESTELSNLKLQDSIDKLEGKIPHNAVKEAMIEAEQEADHLSKSIQGILKQITSAMVDLPGMAGAVLTGQENFGPLKDKLKDIQDQYALAIAAGNTDLQKQLVGQALAAVDASLSVAKQHLQTLQNSANTMGFASSTEGEEKSIQTLALLKQSFENLVGAQDTVTNSSGSSTTALIVQKAALDQLDAEIKGNAIPLYGQLMQQMIKTGNYATEEAKKFVQGWQDSFEKVAAEHPKIVKQISTVWDDLDKERLKQEQDTDQAMLDADKDYYDQLKHASDASIEQNIQNSREMVAAIRTDNENLQASFELKNTGKSGIGLNLAEISEDQQMLARLAQEMQQLETEKQKLISERALIDPSDTANIQKYTQAIAELDSQEAHLGQQGSKTAKDMVNSSNQMFQSFNQSIIQMINGTETFGMAMRKMMIGMVDSVIKGCLQMVEQHLIMDRIRLASTVSTNAAASASSVASDHVTQLSAAKAAAGKAMTTVPFPFDLVVGPLVFAAAMSFETGGKIPGGSGAVPIIGHAGETVVTKALTDRVERSEGRGGAGAMHMHYSPQVHALDSEGVDRVLTKHGTTFRRHVEAQIRQMNRR